ncbi:class I SAM-dependent methyltransferase [Halegenticoccus tardaugens]|uniref:class I SAM-dependent methyltransferase n=1 Tax=Halegenticoccus tardaugens TaxID=2071624 RepID=UPI00100BCF83|nr:class I SAM-dependent methyltransferase [Halegenticoccus tardaugens]
MNSRAAEASSESVDRPSKSPAEIARIYDEEASLVERLGPIDRFLTGRYRRLTFSRASGRVLDVACGTGANFPYLPADVELTGVDLSEEMLAAASRRAAKLDLDADLRVMDASDLDFPDDSFDAVISSLSTCTFPDPGAVLREMARVCEPDGRILLLEHGRSSAGPVARFQDWRAEAHFERMGCRWNQEPTAVVREAGLAVRRVRRGALGILTAMEVDPAGEGEPSG